MSATAPRPWRMLSAVSRAQMLKELRNEVARCLRLAACQATGETGRGTLVALRLRRRAHRYQAAIDALVLAGKERVWDEE